MKALLRQAIPWWLLVPVGHEALSIYLLQQAAESDSSDQYGVTALHNSIRNGMSTVNGVRYDAVYRVRPDNMRSLTKSLLEAGADPNAKIQKSHRLGPDGSAFEMTYATPLILSALSSDVELMHLLTEYEADTSLTAKGGGDAPYCRSPGSLYWVLCISGRQSVEQRKEPPCT